MASESAARKAAGIEDPFGQMTRVCLESGSEVYSQPRHLQGIFPFDGRGFGDAHLLADNLCYVVPRGRRAQLIYFRAGNSTEHLICLTLMRNGSPMRYFPVGARAECHIPLAVIEDLLPETRLELYVAAPEGVSGTAIVDVGLLES